MTTHQFSCSCCSPMWKYFLPQGFELEVPQGAFKKAAPLEGRVTFVHKRGEKAIITMQGAEASPQEAMITLDDKIHFVGDWQEAKRIVARQHLDKAPFFTERVLTDEEVIVPGLIDPHMHTLPTALINCFTNAGPFEGQVLVKDYNVLHVLKVLLSQRKSDMPWILARDVDPSLFTGTADKELNKDVLDQVSQTKPIFAMNASMHLAYVNSVGLGMLSPHLREKASDGILCEADQIIPALRVVVEQCGPHIGDFQNLMFEKVSEIFATASKRGVTTMLDAGVEPSDPKAEKLKNQPGYLSDFVHAEDCPIRLGAALSVSSVDDFETKVLPHYQPDHGDDDFFIRFVKIVSDGSNQGLTGFQTQKYCCDESYIAFTPEQREESDNYGLFNFDSDEAFEDLVKTVHSAGWPLMIHANGDHAISRTIKAYKKASATGAPLIEGRNRIEHCSLASDDHLKDMFDYGISPSFLIGHAGYWGYSFKTLTLGEQRANVLDRCKSALTYGMRYSVHSDNSVSPLGPLRMMEQSISRYMEGAPADAQEKILNKDECVSPLEALRAATIDAAWQCHMDHKIGSLEKGKLADFVLLGQSPLTYRSDQSDNPVAGMRDIPVISTWKGGKEFSHISR